MSDAAGLAWVTLSAWAMLRYTRALRPGWLVLSAFTLGWAVLTRWALALAALPWALSGFLAMACGFLAMAADGGCGRVSRACRWPGVRLAIRF